MNRGDIWTVSGGVYASKPHPALIVQDDRFDATDFITVLPLRTTAVDAPLLRIALRATATTGIRQDSYVMIDKLTVERALMVFLGLAD